MTKFLALIAVAALMVSASDPAFAGHRHRNCCRQSWSGQYGNGQGYYSNNSGNYNGQGYTTQGNAGLMIDGQNAPAPVTTGYPPSESSLDANINSSTRTNRTDVNVNPSIRTNGADVNINSSTRENVAPSGAAARQNVDVKTTAPQPNP